MWLLQDIHIPAHKRLAYKYIICIPCDFLRFSSVRLLYRTTHTRLVMWILRSTHKNLNFLNFHLVKMANDGVKCICLFYNIDRILGCGVGCLAGAKCCCLTRIAVKKLEQTQYFVRYKYCLSIYRYIFHRNCTMK